MSSLRSPIVLLVGVLQCLGHAAAKFSVLDTTPLYPHDSNTTPYCTWWLDSDGSWTCQDVYDIYGISAAEFLQWAMSRTTTAVSNGVTTPTPAQPGMTSNCNRFAQVWENAACVNIAFYYSTTVEDIIAWNGGTIGDVSPTATTGPNGISTPLPTQPGMVSNCDKFALYHGGSRGGMECGSNGIATPTPTQPGMLHKAL
ncbi:hypothetical protein GQ53DRAFT_760418 [Thozetella sp. PMI_491]|nr:hypothetical protein GQ53DRAFT_760418 [Thozetella sp. PMI_491]